MQKNFVKIAQNWVKITRYMSKSKVWLVFYSICAVVQVFITGIRIKENLCTFSLWCFRLKSAFFHIVLYEIGKKLSPWKMKKSPEILFSHFRTNPVQTINIFFKSQIQKICNLSKESITICWILHFRLTFKIKSAQILNSGINLKTFTHGCLQGKPRKCCVIA